ncbi:17837_t:CDS:2 [Entrophospora sp. SA101]|nr:17837_t:CDS:2 [Entrophospora sp. SA101]
MSTIGYFHGAGRTAGMSTVGYFHAAPICCMDPIVDILILTFNYWTGGLD